MAAAAYVRENFIVVRPNEAKANQGTYCVAITARPRSQMILRRQVVSRSALVVGLVAEFEENGAFAHHFARYEFTCKIEAFSASQFHPSFHPDAKNGPRWRQAE